jgi:hypothetical protein
MQGCGVKRRRETSRPSEMDASEPELLFKGLEYGSQVPLQAEQRSGLDWILARLDKLKVVIETLSKANDSPPVDDLNRQLQMMISHVEPAAQDRQNMTKSHMALRQGSKEKSSLNSRQASPHHINTDSNCDEFPIPSGNAADPVDPVGSLNLGHLSLQDGGKSRYVA